MLKTKYKIMLTMIALTLITALCLSFFVVNQADDIVFDNNVSVISSTVFSIAASLDSKLKHTEIVAKTIRQYIINTFDVEKYESDPLFKMQWDQSLHRLIQTLTSDSDGVSSIYVAFIPKDLKHLNHVGYGDHNRDGVIKTIDYKHPALLGVSDASWYHDTWMSRTTTWQILPFKESIDSTDLMEITCSLPVQLEGSIVAVVSVGTSLKVFNALMNDHSIPTPGYLLLTNEKNELLIHPTLAYKTDLNSVFSGRYTELIDSASKESFGYKEYVWTDSTRSVLIFKKLHSQWTLAAAVPHDSLLKQFYSLFKGLLLLIGLVFLVAIFLGRYLTHGIYRPIDELHTYVSNFDSEEIRPTLSLDQKYISLELKQLMSTILRLEAALKENMTTLVAYNNQLDRAVLQKSHELQKTNTILGITVDSLEKQQLELQQVNALLESNKAAIQKAQRQVTNSEKVASIGYLISGISHELNTPIGNNITLATFIDNELRKIQLYMDIDPLPIDSLKECFDNLSESMSLLYNNLKQAQAIITKIKGLTKETNQSHNTTFNVVQAIQDLSQVIFSNYPNQDLSLQLVSEADLLVHTDRDQLMQIIEQLLLNSVQHGFEKRSSGQIIIRMHQRGSYLTLHYFDDGCGIHPDQVQHIFTPFYSTKFGVNKGLGLTILNHLVTKIFNGQISCDAAAQIGVHFEIRLNLPQAISPQEVSST